MFDPMYFVFIIPGVVLMLWAQSRVKGAYAKWSKVQNSRHVTGAQTARMVLDANGLQSVPVEAVRGNLTDHYDPRSRVLRLSEGVYGVPSVSAMAIAAHEAGHAIQHAQGYTWLQVRTRIVPLVSIGSNLGFIVLIAGFMLSITELAWLGVIMFGLSTLFALITLPVEFDASNRAKVALVQTGLADGGVAGGQESKGVKAVLDAAAWTYIASFASSILTLLYYVMQVAGMSRSSD